MGATRLTHRVVWEELVGPIDDTLDHMCRNRACCNPDHLRPIARGENVRIGYSPYLIAYRTNVCLKGHDLSDAYIEATGRRKCRTCTNERQRRNYSLNSEFKAAEARRYRAEKKRGTR